MRPPAPFVVGAPRSGTTLLRLMLNSHPALAIPAETHFIPQLVRSSEAGFSGPGVAEVIISDRHWPAFGLDPDELRERLAERSVVGLAEALRTFYTLYAEGQGKSRWGDKTPWYVTRMPTIAELLPEAHFIHMIRDGRDVAASVRDVWFGPSDVATAARWWMDRISAGRRAGALVPHYLEVRYEALVRDPEPVLKMVCQDIRLDFDPAMLDFHEHASRRLERELHDTEMPDGERISAARRLEAHRFAQAPPDASRIGRWRTDLTPDEQSAFLHVAQSFLEELGYSGA